MEIISRSCSVGEPLELGHPRHVGLLVVDDLAQQPGRVQAGQLAEVDGGLGVAGPLEHAALAGHQRVDVAGAGQVAGPGGRVAQRLHGGAAVVGGDAGGGAVAEVDGDEERGALALGVLHHHRRQVELGGPLGGDRRAEVARGVVEEERDALRRGELGRHDQVALVLAVLVVDHDEDLAAGERRHGVLDPSEGHVRHPSRRAVVRRTWR